MEIRASGEKPEIKQFQLDSGMTVQQMLEKTKLVKKFRRMDIEVLRVTGDERAKLDVKYDHTEAQVKPEYDYALYPGDHVIVQEVTKTALDDMLESVADPLRRATGHGQTHRPKTMIDRPPIAAQGIRPGRIGGCCVLCQPLRAYFLRWRIRARMRRFLRPILRRPFPVFFVPTSKLQTDPVHVFRLAPPI